MNTPLNNDNQTEQHKIFAQAIISKPFNRQVILSLLHRGRRCEFLYFKNFDYNCPQKPVSIKKILQDVEFDTIKELQVITKIADCFIVLCFQDSEEFNTLGQTLITFKPLLLPWYEYDYNFQEYIIDIQRYTKTLLKLCNQHTIAALKIENPQDTIFTKMIQS